MSHELTMRRTDMERYAVDEMHRQLDHELPSSCTAVLAMPIESPQDIFMRDAEANRLTYGSPKRQVAERALCFVRVDKVSGESVGVGGCSSTA